jgi:hypothetical protein
LRGEVSAFDVDVEMFDEKFLSRIRKRRELGDARIGEQHINAPVFFADGLERGVEFRDLRHIGHEAKRVAADFLGCCRDGIRLAPDDDDVGALRFELMSRGQPNTAVAAGDDGDFIL